MNEPSFRMVSAKFQGVGALNRSKNNKREKILNAAIKVFALKGFYNAKVAEIAREAGVADGTIYLYFKNKDDVLISLFEECMAWFMDECKKKLEGSVDVFDQLKMVITYHLHLFEENPELAEVLTVELRQSSKFMREYKPQHFLDYLNMYGAIINEGKQRGEISPTLNTRLVTRMIFGAMDEVALDWALSGKRPYTLSRAAEELADLLISGIRASAPPTPAAG